MVVGGWPVATVRATRACPVFPVLNRSRSSPGLTPLRGIFLVLMGLSFWPPYRQSHHRPCGTVCRLRLRGSCEVAIRDRRSIDADLHPQEAASLQAVVELSFFR